MWDKSAAPIAPAAARTSSSIRSATSISVPSGSELTSTGNIDQGHIIYYRATKSVCSLFIEVHDGDSAQRHRGYETLRVGLGQGPQACDPLRQAGVPVRYRANSANTPRQPAEQPV
jgi:hypothetical protein